MKKEHLVVLAILLTVLTGSLFDIALAQDEVEDEVTISGLSEKELTEALQKWRDDYVRYIITSWEEDEWKSLKTNRQKLEFIEYFWKMRDPDLSTSANEFREEYQRRWNYVNRNFTAGKHGWRTDRGRIYLLLGAPNDIERNPMGRNRSERPSEIWYYNSIANDKLPAQVTIAFVDFMGYGDYEIVSDLERTARMFSERFGISMNNLDAYGLRRAGEMNLAEDAIVSQMFDETVIRNPEILSSELFDLQTELRYIAEVPHLTVRKMSERVRTEISSSEVSFDFNTSLFQGADGEIIMPVTLNIPLSKVSYIEDPQQGRTYQLAIYARLHNAEENLTYEEALNVPVAKEIYTEPEHAGKLDKYLYQFVFAAPQGQYTLNITLRDELSKNVGFKKDSIVLETPRAESLIMSDIVVADLVAPMQNVSPENLASVAPFKIGDRRVVPNVNKLINVDKQDEFFLFFMVNGFALSQTDGKPDISVQYFIYKDNNLVSKTPIAKVESSYRAQASIESRFSAKSLGTGNFRILAVLKDAVSNTTLKQPVEFRIVKSASLN
jgi:GWxTD domain-containing protein